MMTCAGKRGMPESRCGNVGISAGMTIFASQMNLNIQIRSAEDMISAIKEFGILPFFSNAVPGFSVEDMTPAEYFLTDEELGPWDWKVDAVGSGEIAYGKFLFGGKAAFATVKWYREIMNYRRALPKYQPHGVDKEVFEEIRSRGMMTGAELRKRFGVKKNQMDVILMRLMNDTLVTTGAIQRLFRGPDLHYDGWQRSSFCTPDAIYEDEGGDGEDFEAIFFKTKAPARTAQTQAGHSPEASLASLKEHVRSLFPGISDRQLRAVFGD